MSKKTLLNESQIRRFMKLANMEPIGRPFIKSTGRVLREQGEDELEDPVEDDPMAAMPGEAEDDMGMPEDVGPGPGGVDIEGLVSAIADAIETETGVQIEVEGEGAGPGEEEMGMEMPEEEMGMGMEEEPMPGPGGPPMGPGPGAGPPMPPGNRKSYQENRQRRVKALRQRNAAALRRRRSQLQETRLRQYVRREALRLLAEAGLVSEGEHSDFTGAGLADQGSNSDRTFESDDNRQSSAGEHHTGGGKAKVSKTHMGGNSAALPLEEAMLDRLTRRVAARLLDKKRK